MTITASALRELHRLHRQLTDLRDRLQRGPKQVAAAETNVVRLEQEVAKAKEAYIKARVASDDKQVQLKQREDRITDLKGKLNACSSNKEYQALTEQIAADNQANSVLQDEILEALEKLDELQSRVGEAESNLVRAKAESGKIKTRVQDEQGSLESELARVTAELKQSESALPADFKTDFQRISKARGEDALAQVEGECCGGCYQMLTPQTMNLLYQSKPVFCKSCGALLYLAEDRGVGD